MVGGYMRGAALGAMGAPAWTYGLTRGGAGGGQLMGAAAGEEIRTSTGAAGRHSGGDPAIRSSRSG